MSLKSKPNNVDDKLSAIFGLVIGILFIAGGFWVRHIDRHEAETLSETQGTVVGSVSRRERDINNNQDKITYAPVIEFVVQGDRTRFTGPYESSRSSNGNPVVVRYDPAQPQTTARIVDPLEGWTAWSMVGMGGLAVVFSLGDLLVHHFSTVGDPTCEDP